MFDSSFLLCPSVAPGHCDFLWAYFLLCHLFSPRFIPPPLGVVSSVSDDATVSPFVIFLHPPTCPPSPGALKATRRTDRLQTRHLRSTLGLPGCNLETFSDAWTPSLQKRISPPAFPDFFSNPTFCILRFLFHSRVLFSFGKAPRMRAITLILQPPLRCSFRTRLLLHSSS